MRSTDLAHIPRFVLSLLLGSFCVLALLALLGGATRAAPSDSTGTGLDPEIRHITMTSDLPHYDPTGGEGITKTVFFSNATAGVIALTFEISGTPTLTLTTGTAFGDAAQTYTSTVAPWLREVTYSVEAGDGDYLGVTYIVTNTDVQRTTVVITYVRDLAAPTDVTISAPDHISNTQFLVSWSANDAASGVATYTLEYSGTAYADWQPWLPSTTLTSATFTAPATEIDYILRVTAYDYVGNSAQAQTTTHVGPFRIYLPIVMRDYRPLVNGDFEDGLTRWNAGQGPFSGHGSGLPQSVTVFNGGHRALLGEPSASDNSIPVGYGYIAQTFTVDRPYLRLQYWVFSYDIARGSQYYYDTFEVSVNRSPSQISAAERDSRGCASTVLNPDGTLTVSGDGLVFCSGRPGTSGQGTLWDTGAWKTVTLDLSAFQETNITLYLAIWSREYEWPFYNDRAWYNTWAYVDNVQLTNSMLGTSMPDADVQSPNALADTDHADFTGDVDGSGPPR